MRRNCAISCMHRILLKLTPSVCVTARHLYSIRPTGSVFTHFVPSSSPHLSRIALRGRCTAAMGGNTAGVASAAPLAEALPADFDKDQFRQVIQVKALKIPARQCQHYMKLLMPHLLNKPRIRNVMDVEGEPEWRLLLLEEGLDHQAFASRMVQANGKPADAAAGATTLQQVIDADGMEVTDASVELDYSHVSASEVLRRLLPSGMEVPSSFEEVGHIAHLNLRDEALPYRRIIGAVLLEKHPRIRTIINKLGTIENEWRVFDMEVLAGDEDTVAEVKQHGARFKLDFRRVYWNSRLEAEHCRLVEHWFRAGQVVVDAMAGVGPFAVPAGRLGCHVYANDLNPDSYKWLVENIKLNKVGHRVSPFNMDGREFMRLAAGGKLEGEWGPPPAPKVKKSGEAPPAATEGNSLEGSNPAFDHIVMNLPATAVEFLDALPGAFDPALWAGRELPMVHVYAFLRGDETTEDLQKRIEKALGGPLGAAPTFFMVRDVAPNKQMYCASFRVPQSLAFAGTTAVDGEESKRQRVS